MNKILRYTLLAMFASFCTPQTQAVPAYPRTMQVRQSDGTMLSIRLLGDENSHLLTTEDGYPLCYNQQSHNYEYATLHSQQLVTSGIVATAPAQRTVQAREFLQNIDTQSVQQCLAQQSVTRLSAPRRIMKMNEVPTIGTHKALVVLVNFSNSKFSMSSPATYYDEFFHKTGFSRNGAQGCVTEWYKEASTGQYDPVFDVVGPITLSHPSNYYAGGENTVMAGLQDTYKMIIEVAGLIDDQVNFADYDTDGDGVCDNIYCIYAGYGQADTGNQQYIWPHSANLTSIAYTEQGDYSFYADGVKIDRFTVSCEMNGITLVPAGIGTFVHEFGHVLGLADHYNNGDGGSNRPGDWDVMASGVYNNSQNTPPLFTAFERYSLGWLQPQELDLRTNTFVAVPELQANNFAYRISVPGKDNEYFLIENRQQTGWDRYVPGHGALVWHIEEDEQLWNVNMPNGVANHQHVDIVEADKGYSTDGRSSDPFPGTAGVTNFSFRSWDKDTIFAFTHVEELGQSVRFLLDDIDYTLETPKLTVSNITGTSAQVQWNTPLYTREFTLSIYKGDELLLNKRLNDTRYDLTGLEADTEYTIRVVGRNSKLHSEPAELTFSTTGYQIYEMTTKALPATDVTETSFTANWQPISIADDYEVVLLRRQLTGAGMMGTDFTEATQGDYNLPEGWSTNVTTTPNAQYGGSSGPASFRFNSDETYIEIRVPGLKMQNLEFWHRSNNGGNSVTVLQCVDGEWSQVGEPVMADAGVEDIEHFTLDNADAVRIVYHHKMGYFLIDDVTVGYIFWEYYREGTFRTTDTSYAFTGLDANLHYSYCVRAQANGQYAAMSDTIDVLHPGEEDAVVDIPAQQTTMHSDAIYNLQGQRITRAQHGIYIRNRKKIKI